MSLNQATDRLPNVSTRVRDHRTLVGTFSATTAFGGVTQAFCWTTQAFCWTTQGPCGSIVDPGVVSRPVRGKPEMPRQARLLTSRVASATSISLASIDTQ